MGTQFSVTVSIDGVTIGTALFPVVGTFVSSVVGGAVGDVMGRGVGSKVEEMLVLIL